MRSVVRRIFEWLGGHERRVLVAALLVVGGVWLFVELTEEVTEGETRRFDEAVLRIVRDPSDPSLLKGPAWLEGVAIDITALGGHTVLTLLVVAIAGFLAIERRLSAMWLVLGATVGGTAVTGLLKSGIGRERPSIVPHLTEVQTASFPSGHSMMAATVYLTLGVLLMRLEPRRASRAYILAVALVVTVLVGLSRVYLGVHYPTDVLGGWTAGLSWALLCWLVARALQRRGAVEAPSE